MLKRAASPCGADVMKAFGQRVDGAVRRGGLRPSEAKKIKTGLAVAGFQDFESARADVWSAMARNSAATGNDKTLVRGTLRWTVPPPPSPQNVWKSYAVQTAQR